MSPLITGTKRRLILQALSGHTGIVTSVTLNALALKHHEKLSDVRDFLSGAGFVCEQQAVNTPKAPAKAPTMQVAPPVTREEAVAIRRGMIYRDLDDCDWIVTTRDRFERERAAIIRLLDRLGL